MRQGKAFEIPKQLVWQSYQEVRKNRGAAGCDGQRIKQFDERRDRNLYKIWNRLCSGSYFPPPVLEKRIPKDGGKERILGIPTVSDRIAQGAVKLFVESRLDQIFHNDSYGYRPGKSAHQALEVCAQRCWQHSWVLEIDIRAFFDNVQHDLIIKALEHHHMPKWVILYCKRWLRAPMCTADRSQLQDRSIGTPQGGVISPLLANLFLHYAFDKWMDREHQETPFERYADDIVCHCHVMKDAVQLKEGITKRLQEVGLHINEQKTKIVYIDTFKRWNVPTSFTFLGYDFEVRTLKNFKGELYRKCMPGASRKAIRNIARTIKNWRIHRSTEKDIEEFARRYNATLRGWIQYYGKFWYRKFSYHLWSMFQSRLLKWMCSKYRISHRQAEHRLRLVQESNPTLFAHWDLLRASNV
ncbi:group II intron reverse transcriptase/maturase [Candidatus Uhrbacteria bacterium]|nr:group II intron reverse transcriptase/maturase [Candidatus Uhrbacteria bacterium]